MQKYWMGMLASLLISFAASHGRANAHTPRRPSDGRAATALPHNRIYNGTDSGACAWPTAVLVLLPDAICTGTLVHPSVVVYAAHCGTNVDSILFGEDVRGPVFGVGGEPTAVARPEFCNVYPGHDPLGGTDFAYCKLREPVTQVPVVPILMGCEQAALRAGKEVVMVGFGQDQDDNVAIKEEVRSTEGAPASLKVFVGGDGNDTCFGDSGGPVFVQLTASDHLSGTADNSWRVFALTSYGLTSACGDGSFDSLTYLGVPWIEQDSGVDITPCFDAYGHWDPGPGCGGFPTNPGQGGATWSTGCSGAPTRLSGAGATCGAPYDPVSPRLTFITPNDHVSAAASGPTEVALRATDARGGVLKDVHASLDGAPLQAGLHAPPAYRFSPVALTPGVHTVTATGIDTDGNTATGRLKVVVNTADVTSETGGCMMSGTAAGPFAALLALLTLLRRRRGLRGPRRMVAIAAVATVACGPATPAYVSMDVETDGAETRDVMPPVWSRAPDAFARLQGSNGSFRPDTIVSAVFGYTMPDAVTPPSLVVILSDQPEICAALQHNGVRPGAQGVLLQFSHTDIDAEDQPTEGVYSVTRSHDRIRPGGRYVAAGCSRRGTRCEQALADEEIFADGGTVRIATGITHAGAFVSGSIADLRFGDDARLLQGTFVAEHCDLGRVVSGAACF